MPIAHGKTEALTIKGATNDNGTLPFVLSTFKSNCQTDINHYSKPLFDLQRIPFVCYTLCCRFCSNNFVTTAKASFAIFLVSPLRLSVSLDKVCSLSCQSRHLSGTKPSVRGQSAVGSSRASAHSGRSTSSSASHREVAPSRTHILVILMSRSHNCWEDIRWCFC